MTLPAVPLRGWRESAVHLCGDGVCGPVVGLSRSSAPYALKAWGDPQRP
ncbi:hypothetical protein [Streptomyces sp. NPDC048057]